MTKICQLCLEQKPLMNSHIIPEFLHKPLYNEDGRVIAISSDGKRFELTEGFTEHLLCGECEQVISRYEAYASVVVRRILEIKGEPRMVILDDVDYPLFKLFQMSLLWRAGISHHPGYQAVRLGERHSDKLRNMLLEGDPGQNYEYGCWVVVKTHQHLRRYLGFINSGKFDAHHYYMIPTAGIEWVFFVSNHSQMLDAQAKSFFFHDGEPLRVFIQPHELDQVELSNIANELRSSESLRIQTEN